MNKSVVKLSLAEAEEGVIALSGCEYKNNQNYSRIITRARSQPKRVCDQLK